MWKIAQKVLSKPSPSTSADRVSTLPPVFCFITDKFCFLGHYKINVRWECDGFPQLNPEVKEATGFGEKQPQSQINTFACAGFWTASRLTSEAPAWENTVFLELAVLTSHVSANLVSRPDKQLVDQNIHWPQGEILAQMCISRIFRLQKTTGSALTFWSSSVWLPHLKVEFHVSKVALFYKFSWNWTFTFLQGFIHFT